MRPLITVITCALGLLLLGGQGCGGPSPAPVTPFAIGGAPGTGGTTWETTLFWVEIAGGSGSGGTRTTTPPTEYTLCIAKASADSGVQNVAEKTGVSIEKAAAQSCADVELRRCYAEGRCK